MPGLLGADRPVLDPQVIDQRCAGQPLRQRAMLVVKRGPTANAARFLLPDLVTTAGRHAESDIFLNDVSVSRRHAEFRRGVDGFTVRDVGSLNGVVLNRDRVEEAPLAGGDEIQIGRFLLVFFHT
ncbi:MAG: FHA domain-containing protein [Streptomycetales bacterium]